MKKIVLLCVALFLGALVVANADPGPTTTVVASSNITSATTTVVIAARGTPTALYWIGVESSGTNSGNSYFFEYSSVASCASGNTVLAPVGQVPPGTSGFFQASYGGSGGNAANNSAALFPASAPFLLPAGTNLCIVTAGTTTSLYAIALY